MLYSLPLSEMDYSLEAAHSFKHTVIISSESQIPNLPPSSLIIIPYFPGTKLELERPEWSCGLHFPVDWDDPLFRKEIVQCLQPKQPFPTLTLPEGYLTVALHVRRGGAYERYAELSKLFPLKFPPDSFYIAQLRTIAEIFKDKKIYTYIFTDDLDRRPLQKIMPMRSKIPM